MTNNKGETSPLYRIIDANLNRLREGIRVIEDVQRYAYENKNTALNLKNLRHQTKISIEQDLISSRDIKNDVLKTTTKTECKRANLEAILKANFKRAQESSRVLEEVLKLVNEAEAEKFKQIRYEIYEIEREIFGTKAPKI